MSFTLVALDELVLEDRLYLNTLKFVPIVLVELLDGVMYKRGFVNLKIDKLLSPLRILIGIKVKLVPDGRFKVFNEVILENIFSANDAPDKLVTFDKSRVVIPVAPLNAFAPIEVNLLLALEKLLNLVALANALSPIEVRLLASKLVIDVLAKALDPTEVIADEPVREVKPDNPLKALFPTVTLLFVFK